VATATALRASDTKTATASKASKGTHTTKASKGENRGDQAAEAHEVAHGSDNCMVCMPRVRASNPPGGTSR
tara:strand:- start:1567 stop:1779 length:213 start_codon:yes stop_codon:yes gene_type:complete